MPLCLYLGSYVYEDTVENHKRILKDFRPSHQEYVSGICRIRGRSSYRSVHRHCCCSRDRGVADHSLAQVLSEKSPSRCIIQSTYTATDGKGLLSRQLAWLQRYRGRNESKNSGPANDTDSRLSTVVCSQLCSSCGLQNLNATLIFRKSLMSFVTPQRFILIYELCRYWSVLRELLWLI